MVELSTDEYGVMRMAIEEDDWVANRPVSECRLNDEGVNILGMERKEGSYEGVPRGQTKIHPGDTLIL
jgi:Trk K+ transport system NAD-binding subunit